MHNPALIGRTNRRAYKISVILTMMFNHDQNEQRRSRNMSSSPQSWSWIDTAPEGDLIIDPTTNAATSTDVRLYNDNNYGNDSRLTIGKFPNANNYKARTLVKFDLSGIASGATVLRSTMNLKYFEAVNYGGGTWVDRWVQAHELLWLNFDEQWASRENRTIDTHPRQKLLAPRSNLLILT